MVGDCGRAIAAVKRRAESTASSGRSPRMGPAAGVEQDVGRLDVTADPAPAMGHSSPAPTCCRIASNLRRFRNTRVGETVSPTTYEPVRRPVPRRCSAPHGFCRSKGGWSAAQGFAHRDRPRSHLRGCSTGRTCGDQDAGPRHVLRGPAQAGPARAASRRGGAAAAQAARTAITAASSSAVGEPRTTRIRTGSAAPAESPAVLTAGCSRACGMAGPAAWTAAAPTNESGRSGSRAGR
jgi:hypothetical protein